MKRKVRVTFLQTAAYPLFNDDCKSIHGGAEIQFYLLAKKLAEDPNFEVQFVVGNYGQKKVEYRHGVKLIRSHNPTQNQLLNLLKALHYFVILYQTKSDIFLSSTASAAVGLISFFCKLFKKKYIYRSASIIDVDLSWINRNGIGGKIYQFGLEKSTKIIVQNTDQFLQLQKNHSIEGFVFKNIFQFENQRITSEKKHILWVGRIDSMKRPELFLQLAERFPAENFVIICPLWDIYLKEWTATKASAEKLPNVQFIERVPFAEIQTYFNHAKIFVNTSDFEGYPNTYIQAGIGSTPIVSLNVNPDNFLNEWNCGFDCKGSFDKMVEYTQLLLSDNETYNTMSANIFDYVKTNHDLESNIDKFKTLLMYE